MASGSFFEFSSAFWTSYHDVALAAGDADLLVAGRASVDMIVSCLICIVSEVLEKTDNTVFYTYILLIFPVSLWNIFGKKPIIAVDDKCKYNKAYNCAACNDIYKY